MKHLMKKELIKSANELFEKIEELQKSIDYQKDTLVNWTKDNELFQTATEYRDEMIEDVKKLDMLKRSYIEVLNEMIKRI